MEIARAYQALVASTDGAQDCLSAPDMATFLQCLRRLPGWAAAGDADLFAALENGNRQMSGLPASALAGRWFPASYRHADRSLAWCLPDGPPTEPFLDEYLQRCRAGAPARSLVRPRTPLPAPGGLAVEPAGFIFHLSRCGSTLVSGALSELDDTVVVSESPVLGEWVLAAGDDEALHRAHLPGLLALHAACFGPRRLVVKWNAWDLFAWPAIRRVFPDVPCLLLHRDPVEILASHARSAGRHMALDPSLAALDPVFAPPSAGGDLTAARIAVLGRLMEAMLAAAASPGTLAIDYARLDDEGLRTVCRHFGLEAGPAAQGRIAARRARHSKDPATPYIPDATRKQAWFDPATRDRITRALGPLHEELGLGSVLHRDAGE
ncbi:sulfotransferase family protein [Arenimonas caeni]|jgi:hypothetical protein|uniref:Sulfotransferase family protein n=1 Tax=Arenimonas caeni TaxID=2058085 RepID=A0A2P6M8I0_9GAMM|nr:sulfotransferase family protein [Arenimonas caeni]MDY0021838.1 hypothetical protein [Arenimonas caeni]PRH82302.1 sulfotransferase family protein [Arenimonas caeni]